MRSIVIVALLAARAVAGPCDQPGDLCECSKGDEDACQDTYVFPDAKCEHGDPVGCFAYARFLEKHDHAAAVPAWQKACDADFARACFEVGDFLKACVLGDGAGCDRLDPARLAPGDRKRVAAACAKNHDDSCALADLSLDKLASLCDEHHPLACARAARKIEGQRPDRALQLYTSACARIDSACVSEARLIMHTDEGKAIDLLTPLCQKNVPGACVTLDEASHLK